MVHVVERAQHSQGCVGARRLFRRLFQRHGLQAVIAGPTEFTWRGGVLWHGDVAIDLVYKRLTDFWLAEPANATLRSLSTADCSATSAVNFPEVALPERAGRSR